jgi:hypothetical protein
VGERPTEEIVRAVIIRWFGSDEHATDAAVGEIARRLVDLFDART